jgi:hypothetical protein
MGCEHGMVQDHILVEMRGRGSPPECGLLGSRFCEVPRMASRSTMEHGLNGVERELALRGFGGDSTTQVFNSSIKGIHSFIPIHVL